MWSTCGKWNQVVLVGVVIGRLHVVIKMNISTCNGNIFVDVYSPFPIRFAAEIYCDFMYAFCHSLVGRTFADVH